jgi:hypothetical protein
MAPRAARVFWLCLCATGCELPQPSPRLDAVTPGRGYSDQLLRVALSGDAFIPTFRLDPAGDVRRGDVGGYSGRIINGTGAAVLRDFDWLGPGQLTAWLDPGLPSGRAAVEVRDSRGRVARLERAFESLGPDRAAPTVEWLGPAPGTPIAPGASVAVSLRLADVAPGSLADASWLASAGTEIIGSGACPRLPSAEPVRCDFEVTAPETLAVGRDVVVTVAAHDGSPSRNTTTSARIFKVVNRTYAAIIDPESGSSRGGTDLVISGLGFAPDTQVMIGDSLLKMTVVVDEKTIAGRTPVGQAGLVTVTVSSALGTSQVPNGFRYQDPPRITAISPETGDPTGGTSVRIFGRGFDDDTMVYFGDNLAEGLSLLTPQRLSDGEITGKAPAGKGRCSVWVFDADLGWTSLPGGFGWSEP